MIKGVSFDAAGTLLINRYHPSRFARACAEACGIAISDQDESIYMRLLGDRMAEFWQVNQTRSVEGLQGFWLDLTASWLDEAGEERSQAQAVCNEGERQMIETEDWFELYPDVQPAINLLVKQRLPIFVLSNWDLSLHRILESKVCPNPFSTVIASLEEGFEKPDPKIFNVLCSRANLEPSQILHIGDSWRDDIEGALNAGLHAGFVDRSLAISATKEFAGTQMLIRGPSLDSIVEGALSN